jgi:hypothetical protein
MDAMSQYVARATIEAKLADARDRQAGRLIQKQRRAERLRRWRLAVTARWQRFVDDGPETGSWRLVAAPTRPSVTPTIELAQLLDAAAHHIEQRGTAAERRLLEAMAEVVARTAPGTSAALVDPDGSEAARLRAFGVAHGHVFDVLGPREHAWLLEILEDNDLEQPGRVA